MNLWLSPEFFDWNRDSLNPTISKDWDFLKPYHLLKHAKKRLDEVNDKENPDQENLALGDSIYHLRGAIEHREKQLKEKFNLTELSVWESSERKTIPVYEKLYLLGITQPILQKKLIELRNFVAHQQKYPLNKEKSTIIELHEFVWYFIRSTDSFLARNVSGMIFYPPDFSEPEPDSLINGWAYSDSCQYPGCFLVRISPNDKWQIEIRGYELPIRFFSKEEKKDWLELAVSHFDDLVVDEELGPNPFDNLFDDTPTEGWREKRFDKYSSSGESIKHFEGTLIGPPAALRFMIKEYFKLYMYY